MKKILLLIICVAMFIFTGCKKNDKDDARTQQTIFLHLENSSGEPITLKPNNTAVFFFEDNGKSIDYSKSNPSVNDGKLTYNDGTLSSKAKISDSGKPAVYTFENVPNGKYILWVHYYPYSTGVRSSKQLVVNENSHLKIEAKIFKASSGYEEW
ncbi:MAG: hypothetical protein RSD89_01340 [Mucinivorans sp.]